MVRPVRQRNGKVINKKMIVRNIDADGKPRWETAPEDYEVNIPAKTTDNQNWGDRLKGDYEKGTPAWKRASDEDFFGVANLPPQFLSALKDPQFRKDMEAYEMAVRSGDVSVTGKRQELYDKLKGMGVPMGALTDKTRDMDTYLKPEIFKAIEVANRDPKLIPQTPEQTTTTPNPSLSVKPVPTISGGDEDRARVPTQGRQDTDYEDFDKSTIDTTVGDTEDERQIAGAGKTIPLPQTAKDIGLDEPNYRPGDIKSDDLGSLDYSKIMRQKRDFMGNKDKKSMYTAMTDPDKIKADKIAKGFNQQTNTIPKKQAEPKLIVDPLKKPKKFDPILMKKIKSGPLASNSVKPRKVRSDQNGVKSRGLNLGRMTNSGTGLKFPQNPAGGTRTDLAEPIIK